MKVMAKHIGYGDVITGEGRATNNLYTWDNHTVAVVYDEAGNKKVVVYKDTDMVDIDSSNEVSCVY
jgi:hypothetical protein